MARLPYKLVESLAQGLPELITSPSFRVIFIFIRSTIRSDCNFFVAFVRKLREGASDDAHSNKRGEGDAEERHQRRAPDGEKVRLYIQINRNNFRVLQ